MRRDRPAFSKAFATASPERTTVASKCSVEEFAAIQARAEAVDFPVIRRTGDGDFPPPVTSSSKGQEARQLRRHAGVDVVSVS
jgi:hypothetical protein